MLNSIKVFFGGDGNNSTNRQFFIAFFAKDLYDGYI